MTRRPVRILVSMIAFLATAALALSADPPFVLEGPAIVGSIVDRSGYGTADVSAFAISNKAFLPFASTTGWGYSDQGRFITSNDATYASVHLPSGARVVSIEMEACDDSDYGFVLMAFVRCQGSTYCAAGSTLSTGATEIPGCGTFNLPLPNESVIDNDANSYVFLLSNSSFDGSTRWFNARVYYQRQVSPAPPTATFVDVPTGHALHQYVEALAAAGITAGCGGGNFCPNEPVTRGQIAVFLAKALGLHWAP